MPRPQRSFFDQKHSHKSRYKRYWTKSKSDIGQSSKHFASANSVPQTTVPEVSQQAKRRLGTFTYSSTFKMGTGRNTPSIFDKENLAPEASVDFNGQVPGRESGHGCQTAVSIDDLVKESPKTPGGRLALADLLRDSSENTKEGLSIDGASDERIVWEHTRSPLRPGNSNALVGLTKKGRKRARSSSPRSSPRQITPQAYNDKPSFDLHTLSKSLKTPDSVSEASKDRKPQKENDHFTTRPSVAFAHLFQTSSPQNKEMSAIQRSNTSLTRSFSCGTDWPTSKPKRRKITGTTLSLLGQEKGSFAARANISDVSELSIVDALMEKVQDSLIPIVEKDESRNILGSSPPRPTRDSPVANKSSPLHHRSSGSIRDPETQQSFTKILDTEELVDTALQMVHSSDFDDIDDTEMLSAIMAEPMSNTSGKPPANTLSRSQPNNGVEDDEHEPQTEAAIRPTDLKEQKGNVSDDYGDDGDDEMFLSIDLENMISHGTTQINQGNPGQLRERSLSKDARGITDNDKPCVLDTTGTGQMKVNKQTEKYDEDSEDDLELLAAEAGVLLFEESQGHRSFGPSNESLSFRRYCVTNIIASEFKTLDGKLRPQKTVLVEDEITKCSKSLYLRQSWIETPCTKGAYLHVIGNFSTIGECVINDAQNLIILHPDQLISSTVVADSFTCTRRAVLQDRVKATNEASPPQVYGQILHEIFQDAMRANAWNTQWLNDLIDRIVSRYIDSIYDIKITVDQATKYLRSKMPEMQAWSKMFVTAEPKSGALVKDRNDHEVRMSINKLLDVEEHVWSPKYGLKGNIDATVQITLDDHNDRKTLTVPLEVKTGRNKSNASHRAQTALYTLLLSDRYDVEIRYGILYYMETSDISRVPAVRHELIHMIMQRNELACYIRSRLQLPPMLKNPHACNNCYAKVPCFIYHKLTENGTDETSGLNEKFTKATEMLDEGDQTFFQKWDDLLTKEEGELLKFRRELWTMTSSEREKLGRCFANVVIEPGSSLEEVDAPKINRFKYNLIKPDCPPSFSFAESHFSVGDPIVISDEKGHFALANGFVTHIRKNRVKVTVDRRLHNARLKRPGFDAEKNQVFAGIMEIINTDGRPSTMTQAESETPVLYRLDRDEFSNGMATVRNNLIQLMNDARYGSQEIRRLIVELKAPEFRASASAYAAPDAELVNIDQKRAIEKVMSAKDYALVLGMPGTGKTTTIAHIIRALVSQGKSVLLTSYTHTAVDNILLKIRNDNFKILRLGAVSKIHPEVQEFAILASTPKKSIEELQEAYHGPKIVASTCLGINHPVFNERIFDYCIVDEASQITLPVCVGPICLAKTFILVGDHFQLPPLVQNKQAQKEGLDVSLFKLLSEKHPQSVVNLEHQYRMCEDIMRLSNNLIYKGRLKCANEAVAKRDLKIPKLEGLHSIHYSPENLTSSVKDFCVGMNGPLCWIWRLINPDVKACFVNTDSLLPASREEARGSRIVNVIEANIVAQLVRSLLVAGVTSQDIGVISVYRSQLALLRHMLRTFASTVEMHTADKFQGRDKEVVILSLVRNNDAKNVGDLLRDWRRVNVSFTRARTKLLILGSKSTMQGDKLMKDFVDLMEEQNSVYDLPLNTLNSHHFEELQTQGDERASKEASHMKRKANSAFTQSPGKRNKNSPSKGSTDARRLLEKRSVMRDIINDVVG